MRVAYLVSRYPAVSHTFILREVIALRSLGVEVDTFSVRAAGAPDALSDADRDELALTTPLVPLRIRSAVGLVMTLARHPAAWVRTLRAALGHANPGLRAALWQAFYTIEALLLWRHLTRRGITHVHVHFANVAADVARLWRRFADDVDPGTRHTWSFTMHGPTEFDDVTYWGLAGKAADADLVVCISDYCRSQLMAITDERCWSRFHVVRCGIDPDRFETVDRSGAAEEIEVLCVGQLVPRKGQRVLLDAVAALRDRGVDVGVILAADGPSRVSLESAVDGLGIRDRVRFTGNVSQDDIGVLYARADIFCLPSFAEGLPVVLMEAMATGLPVVTTPIAGIPELVVHAESGLLVPPGRSDLLADALALLAADPARRAAMGAAGRRAVVAAHSSIPNAQRLKDLLGPFGS